MHVLDDGFQHFDLMRDVDLLVAPEPSDTRTLPFGRLREPLDAAKDADAILVEDRAEALYHQTLKPVAQDFSPVSPKPQFTFTRRLGGPPPDRRAFAFAGIAKPERFFADLESAGWTLAGRDRSATQSYSGTKRRGEARGESSGADVF